MLLLTPLGREKTVRVTFSRLLYITVESTVVTLQMNASYLRACNLEAGQMIASLKLHRDCLRIFKMQMQMIADASPKLNLALQDCKQFCKFRLGESVCPVFFILFYFFKTDRFMGSN